VWGTRTLGQFRTLLQGNARGIQRDMIQYTTAVATCEACRQRPVTLVIGDDDSSEPYNVCGECGGRLRHLALRPLEWFNLAAKYGWSKPLLHDDFYDDDGTAQQPETDEYSTAGILAPTLNEAARSLTGLVDYCMTRWQLDRREYAAFGPFSTDAVLDELKRRAATGNRHVRGVTLTLCANVLEGAAAPWVRAQHERFRDANELFAWAEAAARCLPHPEGLDMTIDALGAYSGRELRERKSALLWFCSPVVLDWIERHAPSTNVTTDWGLLAAVSDLAWTRVEGWIAGGRPLSLIALDALTEFIPRAGQAPIVTKLQPKLKGCPDHSTLTRVLQTYMATDAAPRVTSKCGYLIEHMSELRVK
jgi:hypothetical protein